MEPEKRYEEQQTQCRKLQLCFFENPAQPAPKTSDPTELKRCWKVSVKQEEIERSRPKSDAWHRCVNKINVSWL